MWLGVEKGLSARSLITWYSAFQVTISCSTAVTFKNYSLLLVWLFTPTQDLLSEIVSLTSLTPRGQSEKWVFKLAFVSLAFAGCYICVDVCVCLCVSEEFSRWLMFHCKSSCLVRSQLGWCLLEEGAPLGVGRRFSGLKNSKTDGNTDSILFRFFLKSQCTCLPNSVMHCVASQRINRDFKHAVCLEYTATQRESED